MKNRAQSTVEYLLILCLVAAALTSAAVYTKRSLQGRIKFNADQLSAESIYAPGATNLITHINRDITESSHSYTDSDTIDGKDHSVSESNSTIIQNYSISQDVQGAGG